MIRIDATDVTAIITDDEIEEMVIEEIEDTFVGIYTDLTAPPSLGTPVDTGAARNGWQLDNAIPLQPEIYNMEPHIGPLNDGHSQQTPAGFVERAVDKHTR